MPVSIVSHVMPTKTFSRKVRLLGHKIDSWLYHAIYVLCKSLGVLPVTRTYHEHPSGHPLGQYKDCFSTNTNVKLTTFCHLCICVLFSYQLAPTSAEITLLSFLWGINWISPITAVLLPLFTSHQLAECMSSACKIYTLPSKHFKKLSLTTFILMMLSPFFAILYVFRFTYVMPPKLLIYYLKYNYMHVPIGGVEVLISMMCFVSQRAYFDVNMRLTAFHKSRGNLKSFTSLRDLLENHLEVGKFVITFSSYFSPQFLDIFLSYTLRTIVYAAYFVRARKSGSNEAMIALVVNILYLTARLCLLCYRCEKVKEEAAKTRILVRRLRILWLDDLTEDQSELIGTYEELMEASAVNFSACGFFSVNMLQVLNVLGLVITYGLVALQSK